MKAEKQKADQVSSYDKALKSVMRLLDVHVLVKNGQWAAAAFEMLALASSLPIMYNQEFKF